MQLSLCHCLLLAVCWINTEAAAPQPAAAASSGNDGSNRCRWLVAGGQLVRRFSAMPGGGWDNLRNKDMGLVADLSFAECSLSDDGNFVLPPSVLLYPRKESQVSVNAQVMEHYSNYTDSLSVTVNVGGHGLLHSFGLGGKFSEEYQRVKTTAVQSKTQIARTQVRYHLYSAKLQPDFKLSKAFHDRLLDIVDALINNQTKQARYLSDLVVRDFGTHFVTSVEAGGALERRDFFDKNLITKTDFMQNKFTTAMSFSFHKLLGINFDTTTTVTKEEIDTYKKSVQKSAVIAHGGPVMGASMNLSAWEKKLLQNLVPIDRDGEPIFNAVTKRALPGVPSPFMMPLVSALRAAVMRYYKANMIKGCLDPNSATFDPTANIDGHCQAPLTNFSFAGVYQTCVDNNPAAGLGLCNGADSQVQRNPITGEFSCPTGYESVKLLQQIGVKSRRCEPKHRSCFIFFRCRDGETCVESSTTVTTYWCSARGTAHLPPDSGMVYAGAYSQDSVNPVTNARSCPAYYRPYRLGTQLTVCLSRDFSAASAVRVPMGGFFSCSSGNPLAEPGRRLVASWGAVSEVSSQNFNSFPKRCPDGFSQMTLDIVDGCSLMICEKFPRPPGRQFARRPPFETPNYRYVGAPVVRITDAGRIWAFNFTSQLWSFAGFQTRKIEEPDSPQAQHGGGGAAVAIWISVLAVSAAVAAVLWLGVSWRRRQCRPVPGDAEARAPMLDASATYGALRDGDEDEEVDVSVRQPSE